MSDDNKPRIDRMTLYFGPAPPRRSQPGDVVIDKQGVKWTCHVETMMDPFLRQRVQVRRGGRYGIEWRSEDGCIVSRKPHGAKRINP